MHFDSNKLAFADFVATKIRHEEGKVFSLWDFATTIQLQ